MALTKTRSRMKADQFDTVAALLAETEGYARFAVSDIIEAGGFRYQVAASGASDHHVTTAGGVKLYVQASAPFRFPSLLQFGIPANDLNGLTVDQATIDTLPDSEPSITRALADFGGIIIPRGVYRAAETIVMGSRRTILFGNEAWIVGDHPTPRPTLRIIGEWNRVTSTGRYSGIRCLAQSLNLNDPTLEGIINMGQDTLTGAKRDVNFNYINGFILAGSTIARANFENGINLDLDNYCGIKMVNGQALPDVGQGSVYDNTITDLKFFELGTGIDCEPVVQGNVFGNFIFFNVVKAGIHFRGSGENAVNGAFFDGLSCHRLLWIDRAPLRIASVTGTFADGEVVTGGTSGATLTLVDDEAHDTTTQELFGVRTGAFVVGETLTGGTSGATAVVDTTRWQYRMSNSGVGRMSQGNTVTNYNGEPASSAPAGVGGRLSRWVYLHGGANSNYVMGRGNTGHAFRDFGEDNHVFQVTAGPSFGQTLSAKNITALGDDKSTFAFFDSATKRTGFGTILPSAKVHVQPNSDLYVEPLRRDHDRLIWTAKADLAVGQAIRFRFTGANRTAYGFAIRASGSEVGALGSTRHVMGEVRAHVLVSAAGTITANVTSLYSKDMAVGQFTATAVGSGFQFDLTVASPSPGTGRFFVSVEADNQWGSLSLESVSVV